MKNLEERRSRFLQDATPMRLGGLATNLGRIASFSNYADYKSVILSMIEESKCFIEWTADDLEAEEAAELAGLQKQLATWERQARTKWQDEDWRKQLAGEANQWSERIHEIAEKLKAK